MIHEELSEKLRFNDPESHFMATERAVDRDFRTTKVYPQFNGYYYVTSGSVHLHPALSMLTSNGSPAMAARVLRGYPQSNACGIKIL